MPWILTGEVLQRYLLYACGFIHHVRNTNKHGWRRCRGTIAVGVFEPSLAMYPCFFSFSYFNPFVTIPYNYQLQNLSTPYTFCFLYFYLYPLPIGRLSLSIPSDSIGRIFRVILSKPKFFLRLQFSSWKKILLLDPFWKYFPWVARVQVIVFLPEFN
jgi:hypothetical protein